MTDLQVPLSEADVRGLKVGEVVNLSGVILTARDTAHKYMVDEWIDCAPAGDEAVLYETLAPLLRGGVLYHCGPVVAQTDGVWRFVSAGPTTSIREEPYEHLVFKHLGVRAVIGKGGMGQQTLAACREHGAVYLHAIGGAGTLIARNVVEVEGLYKEEFGLPEAFWRIRVEGFPTVVTMDSHGNSLHDEVEAVSRERFKALLA